MKKFPTSYTQFRQLTSKVQVRPLLPTVTSLPYVQDLAFKKWEEYMPTANIDQDKRSVI